MSDGAALLAQIISDPADDTARLVFADWLEEHGAEARAEFIRVQVELARMEAHTAALRVSDWGALSRRERELVARWREWLGPAAAVVPDGVPFFERAPLARGLVPSVTCTAADWLTHGDAIRAAHPVTKVRLTTVPEVELNNHDYLVALAGYGEWESAHELGLKLGDVVQLALLKRYWPGVTFVLFGG